MTDATRYCDFIVYPETLETPSEYCDEPAYETADYCYLHLDEA